jgi:hypothetical protein
MAELAALRLLIMVLVVAVEVGVSAGLELVLMEAMAVLELHLLFQAPL